MSLTLLYTDVNNHSSQLQATAGAQQLASDRMTLGKANSTTTSGASLSAYPVGGDGFHEEGIDHGVCIQLKGRARPEKYQAQRFTLLLLDNNATQLAIKRLGRANVISKLYRLSWQTFWGLFPFKYFFKITSSFEQSPWVSN